MDVVASGARMKLTGTAWKFAQEDISTDQIRGKAYGHLPAKEQGPHCLEDIDRGLLRREMTRAISSWPKRELRLRFVDRRSTTREIGYGIAARCRRIVPDGCSWSNTFSGGSVVSRPGIVDFVNSEELYRNRYRKLADP